MSKKTFLQKVVNIIFEIQGKRPLRGEAGRQQKRKNASLLSMFLARCCQSCSRRLRSSANSASVTSLPLSSKAGGSASGSGGLSNRRTIRTVPRTPVTITTTISSQGSPVLGLLGGPMRTALMVSRMMSSAVATALMPGRMKRRRGKGAKGVMKSPRNDESVNTNWQGTSKLYHLLTNKSMKIL